MRDNTFSSWDGLGALLFFTACIVYSVQTGTSLALGFGVGLLAILLYAAKKSGEGKRYLNEIRYEIWNCKNLLLIVAFMGVNIAVWLGSGVVAQMIYSGLSYAAGMNFLTVVFLFTAVLGFIMGTSLGTLSTIGIALIGIGVGVGIPKPLLLGAAISGSYMADRVSPLSGLVNLTLKTLDVDYKSFLKSSMVTLIPVIAISAVLYTMVGASTGGHIDANSIDGIRQGLSDGFHLNPLLLLVPAIMVVMAAVGVNILTCMGVSILLSTFALFQLQGASFSDILNVWLNGFYLHTGNLAIDGLIKGGGFVKMIEIIIIIMFAVSLSRLIETSGILMPLFEPLLKKTENPLGVKLGASLSSMFFTSVACDQALGILIPSGIYGKRADKVGVSRVQLARILGDSGTIIAPLEVWNLNAIIILSVTGVSALEYAPHAYLCLILPVYGLAVSILTRRKHAKLQNENSL